MLPLEAPIFLGVKMLDKKESRENFEKSITHTNPPPTSNAPVGGLDSTPPPSEGGGGGSPGGGGESTESSGE